MRLNLLVLSLVLCLVLVCTTANADFYVVAAGKKAKRTVLVSPKGTATESGTALLNALAGITDASETNPYLIVIEPGINDVGSTSLQMKEYVDIQGSGEGVTKITANMDSSNSGVVNGNNNAELRFLTVENSGTASYHLGVYNHATSPALTHVTVIVEDGSNWNRAVFNQSSSPTITHLTVSASGESGIIGIFNSASTLTMTNVKVDIPLESITYGVYNSNSTVKIDHSVISGVNPVYTTSDSTTFIGSTRLEGGVVDGIGPTTCAGVYDENYFFYASTCP